MPSQPKAHAWPPRTILVGIDDDVTARALVDRATMLAVLLGARLALAHAVCVRVDNVPRDVTGLLEGLEVLDVLAHGRIARWAKHAAKSGVEVTTVVQHGEPLRVLGDAIRTEGAELVVLGAGHGSRLSRAMTGDLRSDLAALGTCAVLTLP